MAQRGGLFDVVKLLDFGLVKPLAEIESPSITLDGSISGTPLFMSPEQARGAANLDARSDIYSLGASRTHCFADAAVRAADPIEVIIAHDRDVVMPLSTLRNDVPEDLERIVMRCLAKRTEDRFQRQKSLEQALSVCAVANEWTQSRAAEWSREHTVGGARSRNEVWSFAID